MPLTSEQQVQVDWLAALVNGNNTPEDGGLADRGKWAEKEVQKEDKIKQIRAQLDRVKEKIHQGQDIAVPVAGGKQVSAFAKSDWREYSDESVQLDTVHHGPDIVEGPGEDALKAMKASLDEVLELQRQMTESGLFSPAEIDEELWDSLVREEVIPGNAVPDAHSRMDKMWKESMKLYDKRLDEFSAAQTGGGEAVEALEYTDTLVDNMTDLTGLGLNLGGMGTSSEQYEILQGVKLTLKAGTNIAKAVLKKDLLTLFDGFPDAISAWSTVAGCDSKLSAALTQGCKAMIKAATVTDKLIRAAKEDKPDLVLAAMADLGDGLQAGFKIAAKVDPGHASNWTTAGATVASGLKVPGVAAGIMVGLKKGNATDVFKIARAAVVASLGTVVDFEPPAQMAGESTTDYNSRVARLKKGMLTATDWEAGVKVAAGEKKKEKKQEKEEPLTPAALAEELGLDPADHDIAALIEEEQKRREDEQKLREAEEAGDHPDENGAAIDAQLRDNRKSYSKELASAFAMDVNPGEEDAADALREMTSIEALLKQMEVDQAIIKTAEAVFNGGVAVVKELFPPARIASTMKEFIKNALAAVERGLEMNRYLDVLGNSKKAHNVYGEAWVNRVQQSRVQMSKKLLDCLAYLAQAVGATMSCTGLAAAAGGVTESAGKIAKIASDMLYAEYNRGKLASAWAKLVKVRENPGDRILMREALWDNPTLSKYAIAYGATVVGDAMALQGLRHAGLTNENLADADPSLVVKYLEMSFPDDPKLLRATHEVKWKPKAVALTLTSWGANRNEALEKAELLGADDGVLDRMFAELEKARTDYQEKEEKTVEAAEHYLKALIELKKALAAYRPLTAPKDGAAPEPNDAMQSYVDQLSDLCDTEADTARQELDTLKFNRALQEKQKDDVAAHPVSEEEKKRRAKVVVVVKRFAAAAGGVADNVKDDATFAYLENAMKAGPVSGFVKRCEQQIPQAPEMKDPLDTFGSELGDFKAKFANFRKKYPPNPDGSESAEGAPALRVLCADLRLLLKGLSRRLTAEAGKLS